MRLISREYDHATKFALCALSFFRRRHVRLPKYKKAKSRKRQQETIGNYAECARLSRHYIARARNAGWSGSVIGAIMEEKG